MRLAILCETNEVSAEFSSEEVRKELKKLLDNYDFDTSWKMLVDRLYNTLRSK